MTVRGAGPALFSPNTSKIFLSNRQNFAAG